MKTKEVNSLKQKTAIKCECGYVVSGNSEKNAKSQLKQHRKSYQHKRLMALNQDISSGAIVDISGANLVKIKEEKSK